MIDFLPVILSVLLCHSERQRRIWGTHLMYIVGSQILHSAYGSVQDDRWWLHSR